MNPESQSFPLSGQQIAITHGSYSATIATVGASLRALTFEDRDLITTFPANSVRPCFHGSTLVPWPNRLAGGCYTYAGVNQQIPVNEPERNNALHGLATWENWDIIKTSTSSVTLSTLIAPQPGYPHAVEVLATFSLGNFGLEWVVDARNIGHSTAPYGVGIHPYLQPQTDSLLDEWTTVVPAEQILQTSTDRLLPIGRHSVSEFENGIYDFRTPRKIGSAKLDHAFTKLIDGHVTVTGPENRGVTLEWDVEQMPWVQLFTSDFGHPDFTRNGLAVEPVSCPPDAFNSGEDLVHLNPGSSHRTIWKVKAI